MKIAIQGHPTRGKEVIQILESLGGNNLHIMTGSTPDCAYYINSCYNIDGNPLEYVKQVYQVYTLEEFEKEFPFKVGDRVISITTGCIGTITKCNKNGCCYVKYDNGNLACIFIQNLKLYKEMERNITLTLDKAKEWYSKGGELKEVALQAFSEKELNSLPRSWKEFCKRYSKEEKEAYIGVMSAIFSCAGTKRDRDEYTDKNICPSEKSAEAHLAMIQLEQLRNCWWDGWKPEWNASLKYAIKNLQGEITILGCSNVAAFLTFPNREMAEEFLKCFRDLIEQAGDLI